MDVLTDVLSTVKTGPTLCVRTEAHSPWGLQFGGNQGFGFHVVVQGGCQLVSVGQAPLPLRAGDVVLMASGTEHTLTDSAASSAVRLRLDDIPQDGSLVARQHRAGPARASRPDRERDADAVLLSGAYRLDSFRPHPLLATLPERVHLPNRRRPGMHAAVDLLCAEVEQQEPGAAAIVSSLVDALLVYILRAWQEDHPTGWTRALRDPLIGSSLVRIHRDPAHPWTVDQLAAEAGLARATFSRRFTGTVGEPPLTYVTRWRMTTAARVLREQDVPLAVVASQVGYSSEFAFAKAFKRRFGEAPGRYRRGAR